MKQLKEGQDSIARARMGNRVVNNSPILASTSKIINKEPKQIPISESAEIAMRILLKQLEKK